MKTSKNSFNPFKSTQRTVGTPVQQIPAPDAENLQRRAKNNQLQFEFSRIIDSSSGTSD